MEDDMYSNEMFVKIRSQINSSLENQKEVNFTIMIIIISYTFIFLNLYIFFFFDKK